MLGSDPGIELKSPRWFGLGCSREVHLSAEALAKEEAPPIRGPG
jgi:hypothetical protein